MPLRRSPLLTPGSLAARRANALRSTGPRTAAGKARTCLNALRHGRRARDLRASLDRTGDSEALFLLDWFHERILQFYQPDNERRWRYTVRLAARVWCFMNGRSLRPRNGENEAEAARRRVVKFRRYGNSLPRPHHLQIAYKRGPGIRFVNPTPTRRRHVLLGWLPEFRYLPGPPPKAKRVRRLREEQGSDGCAVPPGAQDAVAAPGACPTREHREPEYGGPGPQLREVTKNQVQTNLECDRESTACYDLRQREERLESEGFNPLAANLLPVEPEFAEDEPGGFGAPGDDRFEPPGRALIELQWDRWRQVLIRTSGEDHG